MIEKLLAQYPIISDQVDKRELAVILRELKRILDQNIPGDVVEMGCYEGTTSLFIQRLLKTSGSDKRFHAYDSFAGLPEKTTQDQSPAGEQFKAGELHASRQRFIVNFRQAGIELPEIHKAWFSDLTASDIPARVAFAFLDGDFYDSIRDSLNLLERRLVPGATIVVDDYQSEALPGARKAVDEWLRTHRGNMRAEASLAIVQTPLE